MSNEVVKTFAGAFATIPTGRVTGPKISMSKPHMNKVLESLEQAIDAANLQDGMTISFHHHFRNGDYLLNMVVDAIARKGIKGITLATSSLAAIHEAIIPHLEAGVITAIQTSGVRGKLGEYLTSGKLKKPVLIRSHGGRARAIECGELKIDVAFIGAPNCDKNGNMNGREGKSACGSLGYATIDAAYADKVVAITDNLTQGHVFPITIPQTQVDYVVVVDSIGDSSKIASGALRITCDPLQLLLAEFAAGVIEHSGYFKNDFSLQLGSGGASLAVARFIKEKMVRDGIVGSFGTGGITGVFVNMLEEGLFKVLYDVQSFDIPSIESIKKNPNHIEMSASFYANPHNKGAIVNNLDVVVLSATEVDLNFNVNVITDSNGVIMGASGGHSDTAAGANLAIVVVPLLRNRLPMIKDRVHTIVTPGESVDVIVTEYGIAVNPLRQDVLANLQNKGLLLKTIEELQEIAYALAGKPEEIEVSEEIVGIVEYRDGTILDVIRKPL